jgi:hypothetical protein
MTLFELVSLVGIAAAICSPSRTWTGTGYGLPGSPGAKIDVVFGDVHGGFGEVVSIWGRAESPESMFTADLDGDGWLDLLLSTSETAWEGPLYRTTRCR